VGWRKLRKEGAEDREEGRRLEKVKERSGSR